MIRIVRLLERLSNLNYEKIYNDLCKSRKNRVIEKVKGYHVHHICPKSMGGSNEESNLVRLTYREHYIAHKLLTKFTQGEDLIKMEAALRYMTYGTHSGNLKVKHYQSYNTLILPVRNLLNRTTNYDNCITLVIQDVPNKRLSKNFYNMLGLTPNKRNRLTDCLFNLLCSIKKNILDYDSFLINKEYHSKKLKMRVSDTLDMLCERGYLICGDPEPLLPSRYIKLRNLLENNTINLPHNNFIKKQKYLNVLGKDFLLLKHSNGIVVIYPKLLKDLLNIDINLSSKYLLIKLRTNKIECFITEVHSVKDADV